LQLEAAKCDLLNRITVEPHIKTTEVEVMGNMYIVSVHMDDSATLSPIYWSSKPWAVLRGTWFELGSSNRWHPIKENDAAIIEEAHVRTSWREKALADAHLTSWAHSGANKNEERRGSQPTVVLNQVMLDGYEAVWIGDNEVVKLKKDITSKLWNKVGEKFGKGQLYGSTRLIRGYCTSASDSDGLPPIGHLVFAIHGIGQNMDNADIVKSTSDLRETSTTVANKHFSDYWKAKRVEFIPIEWRTWLKLNEGTVASITPHGVKSLRAFANDSLLDIMYYLSPCYHPEILDGLRFQLHKKYDEFMHRNPNFLANGGTISLFAHSLGSVICYDLMYETCFIRGLVPHSMYTKSPSDETDGCSPLMEKQLRELQHLRMKVAELEDQLNISGRSKALKFNVDHFFAVGSPLGIFLAIKEHQKIINKEGRGADSFLHSSVCQRIHNVHHPSDPVAYRLEPLVNQMYSQVKPVKMDSAGSKPTQKSIDSAGGPRPPEVAPPKTSWWSTQSLISNVLKNVTSNNSSNGGASPEPTKPLPQDKLFDDDSKLPPEGRLYERIDFMLREGITENSYINAMTAHTSYWTNADCAMYLLLQIYSYKKRS
jgi:phospholipase DDHD1